MFLLQLFAVLFLLFGIIAFFAGLMAAATTRGPFSGLTSLASLAIGAAPFVIGLILGGVAECLRMLIEIEDHAFNTRQSAAAAAQEASTIAALARGMFDRLIDRDLANK